MPAPLLPDEQIQGIAEKLSRDEINALRMASANDVIHYHGLDSDTIAAFGQLARLGCVDDGVHSLTVLELTDRRSNCIITLNGKKALRYLAAKCDHTAIDDAPQDTSGVWLP